MKSEENKKEKKNEFKKVDRKEKKLEGTQKKEPVKFKHVFIYIFMAIMIIAIIALLFVILNNRFSLIYKNPIAKVDIEGYGEITIELEPSKAPNTVNHFIKLAEDGFYDGKVIYGKDAVSLHFGRGERGEDVEATTSMVDKEIEEGSSLDFAYEIDGEFENNNFKFNNLKHEKYVVSLVRADYSEVFEGLIPQQNSYNSGNSMFKILIEDAPGMNGNYAAFGKVIDGKDIIDELAEAKLKFEEDKEEINVFDKFITIKSITVDTFGRKFPELKLHKKFLWEEFILEYYKDRM